MRLVHLRTPFWRLAVSGLALWAVACPLSGRAATTTVSVENFNFSPSAVTINVNDSVKWSWVSGTHNTTSTSVPSVWASSTMGSGSFTFTFPNAGSFPYTCTLHTSLGMNGSVTVKAASNVPPSVAITSPTNGATFAAPWTGKIQGTVSDPDDTVSKVQFFAGTTPLGTITNPPAAPSLTVSNLAAGNYTLKAVATDSRGATNTSAGITIAVVAPVPIVLSSPKWVPASGFQFEFSANPGLSYVVLKSGTLSGLTPISTNTATSNAVTFLDNNATGAASFYGVHLLANP